MITYEDAYNRLESYRNIKNYNIIDYCQDILSDIRLKKFPDIDINHGDKITFNYNDYLGNELIIMIENDGSDYSDKVLSYYYIKNDDIKSKSKVNWNSVIKVINNFNSGY